MRIFHNDDVDVFFANCAKENLEPNEETMRQYVRSFKGSAITDLCFNIGTQLLSNTPSNVWDFIGEKCDEIGIHADWAKKLEISWQKYHLNYFEILADEAHKCQIHPWISIRMNDVHVNRRSGKGYFLSAKLQSMWDEKANRGYYKENGSAYYDDALDYANEKAYKITLDYILEQINCLDMDGVELDFLREGFCYARGLEEQGRSITRKMVTEIRNAIKNAEKRLGHKVELSIRTFSNPVSDYRSGVDALGLARDGYIDVVVAGSRFGCTDDQIPITIWKRALPDNVLFSASLENESKNYNCAPAFSQPTHEQQVGVCHANICEGADSIYLYNESYATGIQNDHRKELYDDILDESKRLAAKKRYVVQFNDYSAPGEHDHHVQLPVELNDNVLNYGRYTDIRVHVGRNDGPLYLCIGVNAKAENLTVYVNTTKPEYVGMTKVESSYTSNNILVYKVAPLKGNIRCVECKANENHNPPTVIDYVDMRNYCPDLQ